MATRERLEQALRNAHNAGDTAAASRFSAAIRAGEYDDAPQAPQEQPQKEAVYSDVPIFNESTNPSYSNPVPQQGIAAQAIGAGEAGLAALTGATGGTLGMIGGSVYGIGKSIADNTFGTPAGAKQAGDIAAKSAGALTYAPRTQSGQEITQAVGNIAEQFAGATPLTQELGLAAKQLKMAAPIAKQAIASEAELLSPKMSKSKLDVIERIRAGSTENELAPYELKVSDPKLKNADGQLPPEAFRVVSDDAAKAALKQGWEDGTVQSIKNFDDRTARIARAMIDVSEKGKKDDTFKANNRPISELGDAISSQIAHIKRVNREAGANIDKQANLLKNEAVDVSAPVSNFLSKIENDIGVSITQTSEGVRIKFKGSDIEGSTPEFKAAQQVIKNLATRMSDTQNPSAYDVHRLKKYIDSQVSYGAPIGGMKGSVQRVIKGLRSELDGLLDEKYPAYREANDTYRQTKVAIDSMQDLVGKKVDLYGDGAAQSTGKLMRRVLSNAQSAERVKAAALELDNVAVTYGAEGAGDITALVKFADTIDRKFGIAAETSLAGEMEKVAQRGASGSAPGLGEAIYGGSKYLYNKATGVNDQKSYESIRKLLNKQISKKIKEASEK